MKILISICLLLMINIGAFAQHNPLKTEDKFKKTLQLLRIYYVDSINEEKLTEVAIRAILEELDPHSTYLTAAELKKASEQLEGNFEGVGIQFQILRDTINVVDVIAGGPSEKVGIQAGDKIVTIDGVAATGDFVDNEYVLSKLRGPKGTEVRLGMVRRNSREILDFKVVRDKIPLYSVDASYMVEPGIGYIKVNRFAASTMDEFTKAIKELQKQEMTGLILDLRGNSGGYLKTAIEMADIFLPSGQLIVYTQGVHGMKEEYSSTARGGFETGKLVVLVDEGSASASEIVSGAVQDWDRAIIIGRRSYGKGLVQRQFDLPDQSAVRITTSRYYTPTGRCIQKPYDEGTDAYFNDLSERITHGELLHPDSIRFPDSLKFYTPARRVVYGGGGIMPDIFVPMDTTGISDYYTSLYRKNVLNSFALDFLQANRKTLEKQYKTTAEFKKGFIMGDAFMQEFFAYAEKEGVAYDQQGYTESKELLHAVLKGLIARGLFGPEAYYQMIAEIDDELQIAVEVIRNDKSFTDRNIKF